MSRSLPVGCGVVATVVPEPLKGPVGWRDLVSGLVRNRDVRWGGQLLRIASDPVIICDETLAIRHHNRAFLKAIGHRSGHYRGFSLTEFFPGGERAGIHEVFEAWRQGHAAGMRFQASLVTVRGPHLWDFRAVRSRERSGAFVYYLLARDAARPRTPATGDQGPDEDPIFRGLPVAVWRTDDQLRITQVFGSLWPELGVAGADLVGERFGNRHDALLPGILRNLDCSDVITGMSLVCEMEQAGERFSISVEPFLNASGRLLGTIGMVRRSHDPARPGSGEVALRPQHHLPPTVPGDEFVRTRVISREAAK